MGKELTATYEVSGTGSLDVWLSDVENLTVEGVKDWVQESAEIDVRDQNPPRISIRLSCTDEELQELIDEEKIKSGRDG